MVNLAFPLILGTKLTALFDLCMLRKTLCITGQKSNDEQTEDLAPNTVLKVDCLWGIERITSFLSSFTRGVTVFMNHGDIASLPTMV